MTKPKLCQWEQEPCPEERTFYPGKSIRAPYCKYHLAISHIYKKREEASKDKEELEKARQTLKKIPKQSKTEHQRALDRADEWFSRYIRFKYSFEFNGVLYCKCYTCDNSYPMMAMDNGHWQKRNNFTTRFNENNARPQCTACNDHGKGEFAEFELRLIDEIGIEQVEELKTLARQTGENSEQYCREQSDKYRLLCNQLFKERKIKNPWTTK